MFKTISNYYSDLLRLFYSTA